MRTRSPILTLLAVVVLALVVLAVNLTTRTGEDATSDTVATAPPAAPEPAVPPAPADQIGQFPTQATYTGRTSGRKAGEASVAIAVRNGKASAYLCDGKRLESWLEGRTQGSVLEMSGKNGSRLEGALANDTVRGTVTVDGATWQFSLTPGKGQAGLYRARNSTADAGWIVRDDGSQTGVLNINGQAGEAPVLDPSAGSAVLGGTTVPVTTILGGDAATVGR